MRIKVAEPDALNDGGRLIVKVGEVEYGLFRIDSNYYAWRNVCPHALAPVCVGAIRGTRLPSSVYEYKYGMDNQVLRCPWHGWEFDLTSGRHLVSDSKARLLGIPVEADESGVYVLVKD